MSPTPTAHIILFAVEAWGHTRPLCSLAARLVKERPLYITFFTAPNFHGRVEAELSRNFGPNEEQLRELVRVVALSPLAGPVIDPKQFHRYMELFSDSYQDLVDGKPLTCAISKKEIEPVVLPEVMIMDFFCSPALESVRKISKKPVKVYAWVSGQASFMIYPFAPKHLGGRGDLRPRIMEQVANGKPFEEATYEVLQTHTGELMKTVGLPPMYDHELSPQAVPLDKIHGFFVMMMHSFWDQCDGAILSTLESYEPEAIAQITKWQKELSREVYTFGPLFPTGTDAAAGEQKQSEKAEEISHFLDKTLETDGPNSLLYISFGSVFWPTNSEKIWAFIDTVMEKKIPFILSHASPFASIPADFHDKAKAYGKALLSNWSPQQTVLAHPATGWFITHGGQNSTLEALTLGVPTICWPFAGDQPTNAARLSYLLDVAYELFEVRTGESGLKPIHRLGRAPIGTIEALREEAHTVLDKAFGEDGARKRANAQSLAREIAKAWNEDGPARRDLRRFLATLTK